MIIRKTFSQVFAFINVQLFNRYVFSISFIKNLDFAFYTCMLQLTYSLLLRRECCSFSNAEFVKAGLQELEQWCTRTTEQVNYL